MFQHQSIVLIDTNVIIEAQRTGVLRPLAEYFALHTVETVVTEAQTGVQNRDEAENLSAADLRALFKVVYDVSELERATFLSLGSGILLDPGELDLLVYASKFGAADVWLLNSPDKAAVRYCHQKAWQDRVVSLEDMAAHLKLKREWRANYTQRWLSQLKTDLFLGKL